MADSLGTEPELLWPLLLAQIIYDELAARPPRLDYDAVAKRYSAHPLLPPTAPVLAGGAAAKQLYAELLREYSVDTSQEPVMQAQRLAEPLYARYLADLQAKMQENKAAFEATYRRFEEERNLPRDERLPE